MKKRTRFFAILISLAMMLSVFALAIPASADEEKKVVSVNGVQCALPYSLTHNADNKVGDLVLHFDEKGHGDSYAQINEDGTVTVCVGRGDLFWMPGVQIDAQSVIHVEAVMNSTPNAANTIIGPAFDITTETGVWQTATDSCTGGMLYGGKPGFGIGRYQFQYTNTNASLQDGSYWPERWQSYSSSVSVWTADQQINYDISKSGNDVTFTFTDAASGTVITSQTYDDSQRNTFKGPVGFLSCWEAGGKPVFTIKNYQVTNALVDGVRQDFDLVAYIQSQITIDSSDPQSDKPIALEKNTDVVVNGVTFRADILSTNVGKGSSVLVNPNGTITLHLWSGDLFWMPGVTIDEQSEMTLKVSMQPGLDNAYGQQASGFAFNIKTAQEGVWGADSDRCTTVAHRTARRLGVYGASVTDAYPNGNFSTNYFHNQFSESDYLANGGFSAGYWTPGTTLVTKTAIVEGVMNITFINATGGTEKTICTLTGEPNANGMEYTGPIGFFQDWGSSKGCCDYTVETFTVKNALVHGERRDLDVLATLAYHQLSAPNMAFAKTNAEFYDDDVELEFEFEVDESVPETAELVIKRGETVITRAALNTLEKGTVGYLWTAELAGVEKTEILTISLESDGVTVERTNLTYGLGANYQAYLDSLGEPISSDKLNAISYSENFEGLNMTLVPGENLVNGQRWLYVKNSEDGVARIADGKLYISGSANDRILFLDQVYDHINYRFSMSVTYTEAPEVMTVDDDGIDSGAIGYVGGIFNLQEADGEGKQNAIVTAVTPDYLYLRQVIFNADGSYEVKDKQGDCPIGTNANSGLWSQYWSAVQPGSTFYLYGYSGISGYSSGNFCTIPRNPDAELSSKGWGNCWGASRSTRTGIMGIFLGEGQSSAYIDDIKVEVQGTNIKVDGENFPIWGDGTVEIAALERKDAKLLYATVDGVVKYPGETITATRKTKITTTQVTLTTRKASADGETGLKWRTEINKADYDLLAADENVRSIAVGTVVVPTANVAGGLTRETAGVTDIAGSTEWISTSETSYTFEGVRTIAKEERDTSYSGVGYLTVTMKDDTVITVYSDYVTRNHAYALSDFVSQFHDDEEVTTSGNGGDETPTGDNTGTGDPDGTDSATPGTEPVTPETEPTPGKKGCSSTVSGASILLTVAILGGACLFTRRKED